MLDELRRMAMFGSGVVELTRYRAEQMVKGLVNSGDIPSTGAPALVQDLVERSKQTRKELTRFVRDEIKNQIEGLGLASSRELERLERRVTRLEDNLKKVRDSATSTSSLERRIGKLEDDVKAAARPSTGAAVGDSPGTKPRSTAKKSTAKKSTAKKPTAKKPTAKKPTAKKATAKKSIAKKSTGSKSTAQAITDAPAPRTSGT